MLWTHQVLLYYIIKCGYTFRPLYGHHQATRAHENKIIIAKLFLV